MLDTAERLPWAGRSARHALGEMYELVKRHRTTLMFVNTRGQAEMLSRSCGASTTTASPSRFTTARSTPRSAARSKRRWRRESCRPWCAPPPSTSASTGATSISSSISARPRAPRAHPARRPRQSPARRALEGGARSGKPLRGAQCQAEIEAVEAGAQDTPPLRTGAFDVLAQHVLRTRLRRTIFRRQAVWRGSATAPLRPCRARTSMPSWISYSTGGYALSKV